MVCRIVWLELSVFSLQLHPARPGRQYSGTLATKSSKRYISDDRNFPSLPWTLKDELKGAEKPAKFSLSITSASSMERLARCRKASNTSLVAAAHRLSKR